MSSLSLLMLPAHAGAFFPISARAVLTQHSYDAVGRLLTTSYPGGSLPTVTRENGVIAPR